MISIVIPALNEEENIGKCLTSLALQSTSKPFEVIVVDNGSTDSTKWVCERFHAILDVRVVQEPVKCRGRARRTGFNHARGDIILSTDADAILPENWIEALVSKLETTDADAVVGNYVIRDQGIATFVIHGLWMHMWAYAFRMACGYYVLRSSTFAITREAYDRSGGFSTDADAAEDLELSKRVSKTSRIAYVPSILIIASGRRFEKSVIAGLLEYMTVFKKFFLGERVTSFSNIR